MLPFSANCQQRNLNIEFKTRTLKPYDYFERDNMSFFTFDYYQTRFLLEQKKVKDLYNKRLSLQDSLISNNDSIIKNYKSIIILKNQQLDSTNKILEYSNHIVAIQKIIISDKKNKIKNKNTVIITLIGVIGATFFVFH